MLKNVFERVCVVNLQRRNDRWEDFLKTLPKDWPFDEPVRYAAVDGGLASPPHWWKDGGGAWGCYRTHLRIWEDCMNDNVESVLILEDDAVCVEGFANKVAEFWRHLPDDWGMIYLGGQHLEEHIRLPRKINDWVYKPFNINRTHCYGLRGREMMTAAYRHLHDFASWDVAHHIDHYLGVFHKKTEKGIYVPRRWLVKQSAGVSDVCCHDVEARLFWGAEDLISPKLDMPGVAILGNYFSGTNTVAGAMRKMGLCLGTDLHQPEDVKAPYFFEDHWLGTKCRSCYAEPWLTEQLPREDRINHLRHWAGIQCHYKKEGASMFCGKHPVLSLMGEEIREAWNEPKFICVERSDGECTNALLNARWGWHPTAAAYVTTMLRKEQERFFEAHSTSLLKIRYDDIVAQPEITLEKICRFLGYHPDQAQWENAIALMKCSKDDIVPYE